ncbi:hypothetical protein DFH07DRAFT_936256 [Mycena maculata]|uniref:Uncharacterized protein n=1 Tax=Mycena maculata TaxID=230809 RepID=A0AAD7K6J7_9AGAR|nr:hypothetical protein DFH07DRAFT_936256 [Mycena maculata]
MSDSSEILLLDDEPCSPLFCDEEALDSEATLEGDAEPPSPNGSIKAMHTRSRPTSMEGPIEFPPLVLHFAEYGMTPASPAPVTFTFPMPPFIAPPPPGKKRRYAASLKSLYTGTGTGTSLKTNCAPIVPVQLVRRDLCDELEVPEKGKSRRGWLKLKKLVPGLFHRPSAPATRPLSPLDFDSMPPLTPTAPATGFSMPPASASTRTRALSIRSFRSTKASKSKGKARAIGIENRPPPLPVRAVRPRGYSFSGYLSDEDETDPEVRAIERETYATVQSINKNFVFEPVEVDQHFGVAC